MKYAYVGDHESINFYGDIYPVGVFVDVNNPMALSKLPGHPHFKAEIVEQSNDDAPIAGDVEIAPDIPHVRRGRKAK
jgi:hypothetical protein